MLMLSKRASLLSNFMTMVPTHLIIVASPPIPLMVAFIILMLVIKLASLIVYQLAATSMTYISLCVSEIKQQGSFLRADGGYVVGSVLGSYGAVASFSLSVLTVQFLKMVSI